MLNLLTAPVPMWLPVWLSLCVFGLIVISKIQFERLLGKIEAKDRHMAAMEAFYEADFKQWKMAADIVTAADLRAIAKLPRHSRIRKALLKYAEGLSPEVAATAVLHPENNMFPWERPASGYANQASKDDAAMCRQLKGEAALSNCSATKTS